MGPMASGYFDSRNSCTAARRIFGSGLRRFRITSSKRTCWADDRDGAPRRTDAHKSKRGGLVMENTGGSVVIVRHNGPGAPRGGPTSTTAPGALSQVDG